MTTTEKKSSYKVFQEKNFSHFGCTVSVHSYHKMAGIYLFPNKVNQVVGRGFNISFPVSSHDMLKSLRTCRVRVVMMEGAITRL